MIDLYRGHPISANTAIAKTVTGSMSLRIPEPCILLGEPRRDLLLNLPSGKEGRGSEPKGKDCCRSCCCSSKDSVHCKYKGQFMRVFGRYIQGYVYI
jgi:hypothetical protein